MTFWVKNIAKQLTLLAVLLMVVAGYAHAQNDWEYPYIDSWQKYRVPMGADANRVSWDLMQDDPDSPTTAHDLSDLFTGGATWIDIYHPEDIAGTDYAAIEIKFIGANFANGQTWYLVYSEWDASDNCTAMRSIEINIVGNSFYLSLGADGQDCNSLEGEVLNWNNINGIDIESYVDFDIQMNKLDNFAMNSWSFSGSLSLVENNYTLLRVRSISDVLSGTSNAGENFTITDSGSGNFSVIVDAEATSPSDPAAAYSDYITIRVYLDGLVYEGETVNLEIENGKAQSGTEYTKETDDNLNEGGDREQQMIILPLPATPNIAIVD